MLRPAGSKAKVIMEEIRMTAERMHSEDKEETVHAASDVGKDFAADLRRLDDKQKAEVGNALRDPEIPLESADSLMASHPLPRTLAAAM